MIKVADILAASILIVDDKEANVSLLAQMLRQHVARGWASGHVPEVGND